MSNVKLLVIAIAALLLASISAVTAGTVALIMNARDNADYTNVRAEVSFTRGEAQ